MTAKEKERLEAEAAVVKTLAHPTRLLIVHAVARTPRCVRDLTALVGTDITTVSKHLSILRAAGIVVSTKRRQQVFYSLNCPCVLEFLRCVTKVMTSVTHSRMRLLK